MTDVPVQIDPTDATDGPDDGPDWPAFYRSTIGREPRPLFVRGMAVATAAGRLPGQAIEIGFGDGTETLALLTRGWQVLAIDPTPAAAEGLRSLVPAEQVDRIEVVTAGGEAATLRPFDLLYAGYALPFIHPTRFEAFWAGVRSALRPGGVLIVNLFGDRDSWVGDPGMTFVDRARVDALVDGLDLLDLAEEEADGEAFSGPKHWHVFDIVARRPASS